MKRNLTQPEEVDLALNEMAARDLNKMAARVADKKHMHHKHAAIQADSNAGYLTPYRAAYMKAHNIEPR
ncbi:MAG: hypothetical protein WAW02_13940 [Sideroxyarcus sp.]